MQSSSKIAMSFSKVPAEVIVNNKPTFLKTLKKVGTGRVCDPPDGDLAQHAVDYENRTYRRQCIVGSQMHTSFVKTGNELKSNLEFANHSMLHCGGPRKSGRWVGYTGQEEGVQFDHATSDGTSCKCP